jgi:hypothetical protein
MGCGKLLPVLAATPGPVHDLGGPTMNTLSRNGGLWIAVGTAAGALVGVMLGVASIGLALGLVLGIVGGYVARR